MTFELDDVATACRAAAEACGRDVVGPAAAAIDTAADVPGAVVAAARAVLPAEPATAGVAWTVAIEALATASATVALAAAAQALGHPWRAPAQWAGLRGADVDGLRAALAADPMWQLAVTATLIGGARAALEASIAALKSGRAAGTPNDAAPPDVADAATAIDASRLLLQAAAGQTGSGGATARALARLHTLDAVTLAFAAAATAAGAEAFRPGAALERARRDAQTAAQVLGEDAAARAIAAAGTLPA
jgi:hypothetical protein